MPWPTRSAGEERVQPVAASPRRETRPANHAFLERANLRTRLVARRKKAPRVARPHRIGRHPPARYFQVATCRARSEDGPRGSASMCSVSPVTGNLEWRFLKLPVASFGYNFRIAVY